MKKYDIKRVIKEGKDGIIYECKNREGEIYAIKEFKITKYYDRAIYLSKVVDQITILKSLSHPNVFYLLI